MEGTPGGSEFRHVRARVTGPDGEEELARSIHFSPRYERHAAIFRQGRRRREECAVLALASEPKRRRMQENLEYEQQTAEALAVERREIVRPPRAAGPRVAAAVCDAERRRPRAAW